MTRFHLAATAVAAVVAAHAAGAQTPVVRASDVHRAPATAPTTASRAAAKAAPKPVAKPVAKPAVVTIEREVFAYGGGDRRDPFKSLFTTSELRPTIAELRLVGVAYDPAGGGSVAILRDVNTKGQHRVRVGTLLGRMRVSRIGPKAVVFTVEELGYSRQETLGLNDSTAVRSK